ncbi:MAG: hypothetical protein JXB19_04515 [Bacteroidales bacterium]|nr:hypothetical protein [Bacteroidales bacterium]
MLFNLRHIVTVTGLTAFITLSGQTVPWVTPSASLNAVPLIINCIPRIDGQSLSEGDFIGIFDDAGRCFGLARWKDTADFRITVYGSDGTTDGFNAGDPLNLKIWLSNENCILEHISQVESDNPLIFSNTATNSINILDYERINVGYPKPEYCLNEKDIRPLLSHPVENLLFQADNNLNIDAETGLIDPVTSAAGDYTIALNSDRCLNSNSLTLTLNEIPPIISMPDTFICGDALTLSVTDGYRSVQWSTGTVSQEVRLTEAATIWYRVTNDKGCSNSDTFQVEKISIVNVDLRIGDADCYEKGRIEIRDQEIAGGRPPYTYKVTNLIDNSEVSTLTELPEGVYSLEIINDNGCALRYPQNLVVRKDCLNDRPVFSPNEDGLDDRYFISFEGSVRIFDRNGNLKRRLTGPVYFDGNDSNGTLLPMGTYLVVSEKGESITLTIIR